MGFFFFFFNFQPKATRAGDEKHRKKSTWPNWKMYEINFHTKFSSTWFASLLVFTFFGQFDSTKLNSIRKVLDGKVRNFLPTKMSSFTVHLVSRLRWQPHPCAHHVYSHVYSQFWLGCNSGDPEKMCSLTEIMQQKKKFEVPQNPEISKIDHIRQNLYDAHEKLYKRYGRTAKPVEEATNARLASVSIVEWVIFFVQNEKNVVLGKFDSSYKPKLRVNRLRVIRICKVCESMRFASGPEVIVTVQTEIMC